MTACRSEGLRTALPILLLLVAAAGVGIGPAAGAPTPLAATDAAEGTLTLTQTVELTPDDPGHVRVTLALEAPDNLVDATVTPPERATVLDTDGFRLTAGGDLAWNASTDGDRPTATYRLAVNETGAALGPEGDDGRFRLADPGDWAIVRRPSVGMAYRFRGELSVDRRVTVDGPGAVGDSLLFLGPHETATRSAHGQRFRLVVPEAADLNPSRRAVLDSLSRASDALRVGDRDEDVFVIAAPTGVDWGVRGLQLGDADAYVVADEPLDSASNTWLHEYVHTRQNLSLTSETRWLGEATATYYAGLLAWEQDLVDTDEFLSLLERGRAPRFDDVVLADPSTWSPAAAYYRGALVTGDLDRTLRTASDRRVGFGTLVRDLNARSAPLDRAALRSVARDAGSAEFAQRLDRFTGSSAAPELWSAGTHERVFMPLPARIGWDFASTSNETAWRVSGPYRNGTVDASGGPTLVPGETLSVGIPVSNAGETAGTYDLAVRFDGAVVAELSGSLGPGERVTEPVSVTAEEVGTRPLSIGTDRIPVRVREPAELRVRDLTVNRSTVAPGEAVAVTARVANDAARPGSTRFVLRLGDRTLSERTVDLGPGEETDLSTTIRPESPGEYDLTFGDGTVQLTVTGSSGATGGGSPGFGVGGALVALAGLLVATAGGLALSRRRRSRR